MKKNIFLLAIIALSVLGCKKIPEGNISDIIRYETVPELIPQGRTGVTTALNFAGSAKPLHVKLLAIYDKSTGEEVTDIFLKKYPFQLWTKLYDPKVDTTIELINAKRVDTMVYPLQINPISGQIEYNYTSIHVPLGEYSFDLEISNPVGKKIYKNIGEFNIVEATMFEVPAVRSTTAMKVGAETTTKAIPSNATHQKVVKLNDTEDKVIVKIVDQHGTPFNPKAGEIARRPVGGNSAGFLQTMQDYALTTTLYDDRMEFTYGVVPFPLNSLGNGFNYYYRIPAQFVRYDASLGLPDDQYSCNARFALRIYGPGTYEVTVIVPQVTKR